MTFDRAAPPGAKSDPSVLWAIAGSALLAAAGAIAWIVFLHSSPSVQQAVAPPPAEAAREAAAAAIAMESTAALPEKESLLSPASGLMPLSRDELREVQQRLRGFGFDPGAIDGAVGRNTQGAVMRYQRDRGFAQDGAIDQTLLTQLRGDPGPQYAAQPQPPQSPPRPSWSVANRPAAGPSGSATTAGNPLLSSIKNMGDQFGRWLNSIGH